MHLANSVMERAEAVCRDLNATNVPSFPFFFFSLSIHIYFSFFEIGLGFNLQINMESVVGVGHAKNVICSAVKKLEADTLVMGTHGYGFIKR